MNLGNNVVPESLDREGEEKTEDGMHEVLVLVEEAEEVDVLELSRESEVGNEESDQVHGYVEEQQVYTLEEGILDEDSSPFVLIEAVIDVLGVEVEHPQHDVLYIHRNINKN